MMSMRRIEKQIDIQLVVRILAHTNRQQSLIRPLNIKFKVNQYNYIGIMLHSTFHSKRLHNQVANEV